MNIVSIYECLCDRTRLRIVNLLRDGPLCVCHLQDVLGESQVKVSKHLGYLKERGLVTVTREGYWRIYALTAEPHAVLTANVECLRQCAKEDKMLKRDLGKLEEVRATIGCDGPACCAKPRRTALAGRKSR